MIKQLEVNLSELRDIIVEEKGIKYYQSLFDDNKEQRELIKILFEYSAKNQGKRKVK